MKRVVFFYQNAYSQTGGIQTFNKYFISALEEIKNDSDNFDAEIVGIYDNPQDISTSLKYTTLNSSKLSAFAYVLKNSKKFDTFIFAHVNLAPLAIFLKLLNKECKIVFITHGIEVWRKLPIYTEKIMNKSTILTVSNFSKNELLKFNDELKDIIVFPNCIKQEKVSHNASNPYSQEDFNILSVTRLTKGEESKGIDSVIRTIPLLVKKIPNLKYTVIGKGEDVVRLKELANKLKVNRYVDFLGFVNDINLYYKFCDVFALPSKKEGFGIVFLEAMQYKKPIIACNYGGPVDVIIDGKTGFLCSYNDLECLKNRILSLHDNEELRKELGENGYRRFKDNFTFEKFKGRLESILL